jgi:biotin carboxyl carrier protein
MNRQKLSNKQHGFAAVELLIIVIVLAAVGFVGYKVLTDKKDTKANTVSGSSAKKETSEDSAKIKNLGINLGYYDPDTGMAGDIKFVKFDTKSGGLDAIFSEYGRPAPENNGQGAGRLNPQPTFVAPLGTKVHSLVDGKVFKVEKLYSGDYSVMVMPEGSELTFETEHIKDVTVKEGDTVKAGDVVGVVSDYDARNLNGLGLVEIGVLLGGNPPKHLCTFDYLDDSIKAETLKKITALEDSWEEFMGDKNVYQQDKEPVAGCRTQDAIED